MESFGHPIFALRAALNGLGGFDCPRASSDPDDPANAALRGDTSRGCYFYNPLGSSFTSSDPTLRNEGENTAFAWFHQRRPGAYERSQYWIFDALTTGDLPFELPGGNLGLALGFQASRMHPQWDQVGSHRLEDQNERKAPDDYVDNIFLGALSVEGADYYRSWYEYFGELYLPLTERIDVDLSVRRGEYPSSDLSHTSPSVAIEFRATDWMEIRLGYQNAFRVDLNARDQRIVTRYIGQRLDGRDFAEWIPILSKNNASAPEESDSYTLGATFQPPFLPQASVDIEYYEIKVDGMFARQGQNDWVIDYNNAGEPSQIK